MSILIFSPFVSAVADTILINQTVNNSTTPTPTPAPTILGGGPPTLFQDKTLPIISNLEIIVSENSSTIMWQTNKPALSKISWGKSSDYEKGVLSEALFLENHSINIENLSADTPYFFKIELVDSFNNKNMMDNQEFQTLAPPDTTAPANVSNLKIIPSEKDITLKWENPSDLDFKAIRIMRSENFYPAGPLDGKLVYEGTAQQIIDSELEKGKQYYYSIFSRDETGNYSSGAIASSQLLEVADINVGVSVTQSPDFKDPFKEISKDIRPHPQIEKITVLDFDFTQQAEKISFAGNEIKIDGRKDLKISLDYDKVPEVLKTIAITVHDPENYNKTFSFLLRVNKEKSSYEAAIGALGKGGIYPVDITVLDYKNQGLKKISGQLSVSPKKVENKSYITAILSKVDKDTQKLALSIFAIIFLLAIGRIVFF